MLLDDIFKKFWFYFKIICIERKKLIFFLGVIIITVKNNDNISTFQTATIH